MSEQTRHRGSTGRTRTGSHHSVLGRPNRPPFSTILASGFRIVDFAFVAIAPVLMALGFLLPLETRRALAFRHADPTLWTAFAANYVHFDLTHLLTNVGSYLLVVAVVYALALLNGDRVRFYTVLGVILLLFPIPLSYLTAAFPLFSTIVGFSGITMSIVGFGLVELALYLRTHFPGSIEGTTAPGFFFAATTYVAGTYADSTVGIVLCAISLVLTVGYWTTYVWSLAPLGTWIGFVVARAGYFGVLLIGAALLSAIVLTAFPRHPVTDHGIINVYLHLIGFSLGFIAAYTWVLVIDGEVSTVVS